MQNIEVYENNRKITTMGPFTEKEAQAVVEDFGKQLASKDIELVSHDKTSPFDLRDNDGLAETFVFSDNNKNTFQVNLIYTNIRWH